MYNIKEIRAGVWRVSCEPLNLSQRAVDRGWVSHDHEWIRTQQALCLLLMDSIGTQSRERTWDEGIINEGCLLVFLRFDHIPSQSSTLTSSRNKYWRSSMLCRTVATCVISWTSFPFLLSTTFGYYCCQHCDAHRLTAIRFNPTCPSERQHCILLS